MSDVLGTGAYGDPAKPNQSREEFNAANGVTDDPLAPSATAEETTTPAPPKTPKAPTVPDPAGAAAPEAPTA